jgi:hypothetical protein
MEWPRAQQQIVFHLIAMQKAAIHFDRRDS